MSANDATIHRWCNLQQTHISVFDQSMLHPYFSGLFPAILGKGPGQNWGKLIDLRAKLGEITNIDITNPQNQVILDCIMPTIPLNHKCLSIILIWAIVSHKKYCSGL